MLHHIINSLWTRHYLLCLVSLYILISSTSFPYTTFDSIDVPRTELLILDSNLDKSFDLRQIDQLCFLPTSISRFFIKDYRLLVHEATYYRLWNQVKKDCLSFDTPIFFRHALLYSTENPPLLAFNS